MDHVPLKETTEAVAGVNLAMLAGGERMNVQHFELEPGARVPAHSHEHEQVGFVYSGEIHFLVDNETYVVQAGDSYALPSHETHAAENRGDEPIRGVDIFSPPRPNPDWNGN